MTFPDLTRHFFSSLTETVDGLFDCRTDSIDTSEKAVLLYLTPSFREAGLADPGLARSANLTAPRWGIQV